MNTMKTLRNTLILALALIAGAFAQQNTLVQTTTAASMTQTQNFISLTSATGVVAPSNIVAGSSLFIQEIGQPGGELATVQSLSGNIANIARDTSRAKSHTNGASVWIASAPNWFNFVDPMGTCTTALTFVTPYLNVQTGRRYTCDPVTGTWVLNSDGLFFVEPTACTTAPTTSTVTNTYPQIGASNVFVLNATTNSAAGTTTLVCNILVPTRVTASRGAVLRDIVVAVGSQTTAPTSIGTATLASITFPTPVATTQTASTVTPVAAGGTITQLGPTTTVATVTTAGAFLTFKYTPGTTVNLSTDLQMLQFTVPYLQSAAAVMTLNFPGLWVHYTAPAL